MGAFVLGAGASALTIKVESLEDGKFRYRTSMIFANRVCTDAMGWTPPEDVMVTV